MTVMLALSTIGCRLQTCAGCSEIEIGCAHGRNKGRGFEVSFVKGKLIDMQNHLAAQRVT